MALRFPWQRGEGEAQRSTSTDANRVTFDALEADEALRAKRAQWKEDEKKRFELFRKRLEQKRVKLTAEWQIRLCLQETGFSHIASGFEVVGRKYLLDSRQRLSGRNDGECWRRIITGTIQNVSVINGFKLVLVLDHDLFDREALTGPNNCRKVILDCFDEAFGVEHCRGWHSPWISAGKSIFTEDSYIEHLKFKLV